jgi:hypothetical protein
MPTPLHGEPSSGESTPPGEHTALSRSSADGKKQPNALPVPGPVLRRVGAAHSAKPSTKPDSSTAAPAPIRDHSALKRQRERSREVQRASPAAAIDSEAPLPLPPQTGSWDQPLHRHGRPSYDEKPIGSLTTNILPGRGDLPANYAAARFDKEGLELHIVGTSRPWMEAVYDWEATAFCHWPLYFEQPNAERLGHTAGPILQPVISGAHFFAHIPALPYMMTAEPPIECIHTLGHYRPGSYAPLRYIRLPLSISGAAVQAGVVTGLVYLIP